MWLGRKWYTSSQCLAILRRKPAPGDDLTPLCKELITAKLNSVINPLSDDVRTTIAKCDAMIGARVPGVHTLGGADASDLLGKLFDYNNNNN
jgi:hypothetical protein